ncbi:MAG: cation-translocating P-type ATPase [Candidatus Micrarchaeota archaeon]
MKKKFRIEDIPGLSDEEAAVLLRKDGPNELPSSKPRNVLTIALEVIREPMFILLVVCGMIYLTLGETIDALLLFSFVFIIMAITFYQERKTERALEALRDLSSPRALVMRGGKQMRIAGREVVRGDILILNEGDRIPTDAVMLSCTNFSVNESMLTGESVPVRKRAWDGFEKPSRPGGEGLPFIYSGTLVIKGSGIGRVLEIGGNTEMGRIGRALKVIEPERTSLQKETGQIVRKFALAGISLCAFVVLAYGYIRGDWLNGLLAGITLAMAVLPEEFPVVLTVFLALGAWRISKKSVLISRVPNIETIGSATVLCVDKTGTLTLNQMSVESMSVKNKFWRSGKERELIEDFHELLEFSILASQRDPFDPMESAIKDLGKTAPFRTEHLHNDWELVREYPLSEEILAMSHVWESPDGKEYIIAVKGAPEAVADLCHFNKKQHEALSKNINKMASEGLRIIGVAKAYFKQKKLPGKQHDFKFEFLGLLGFSDPIRPGVPKSVRECYGAGIRIVMITGDYPETAKNIARQIGLENADQLITGSELDSMSDEELQRHIRTTGIFARVVPEQKLRIVNALKENGEIVAMTGDGVNDAPALKSANIGVAMGKRGTDVARESSALILLDDNFSSIVGAVRMGRRLLDNIKKAMTYIIAVHVPIAGLSSIPVVLNWPIVLLPAHVVFLELIIDPACSIVFEAEKEEPNVMKRKPRDPRKPLLDRRTVGISLLQGLGVLAIVLVLYWACLYEGMDEARARAITFTALVIANLSLILTNLAWSRSLFDILRSKNDALWLVFIGALIVLGLVLYVPFFQTLFHFSALQPADLAVSFVAGASGIVWFEVLKFFHRKRVTVEGVVSL